MWVFKLYTVLNITSKHLLIVNLFFFLFSIILCSHHFSLNRNKISFLNRQTGCKFTLKKMLIKLTVLCSLLLQLEVTEAIPYISAAVVYFPLICCNLEGIDLMPRPTRTRFTDMDCCKASLIDAEHCSRILNERAMKQVDA